MTSPNSLAWLHLEAGRLGDAIVYASSSFAEEPEASTTLSLVSRILVLAPAHWPARTLGSALAAVVDHAPLSGHSEAVSRALPADLLPDSPDLVARLAGMPWFLRFISHSVVAHERLECLLLAARKIVVRTPTAAPLEVTCALAAQAFLNEYVWPPVAENIALDDRLPDATALAQACLRGPLLDHPLIDRLLALSWPPPINALLTMTAREPLMERAIEGSIPSRGGIDPSSTIVRAHYERWPYPRWRMASLPRTVATWVERFRSRYPAETDLGECRRVLIVGCGTGQQPIELARACPELKITAIDLSRRSLAYAIRQARALGMSGIDFAQADLLDEAACDPPYDIVYATGVVHHLSDPVAGIQKLAARLRVGGVLQLGLYSRTARTALRRTRERLAPGETDVVNLRRTILEGPPGPDRQRLLGWRDFFSTSECRDLLLHPREHEVDLAEVAQLLGACGLRFVGFQHEDPRTPALFSAETGASPDDLVAWADFERRHPDAFRGMYQFHVRRK